MEKTIIAKHRMVLLRIVGELDHHTAVRIRQSLEKDIKRSGAVNIALDFGRVSFMDSSGIGMILGRYKTVKALGGHIIIFDANEQVKRLLEMSGLNSIVIVSDTLQKGISQMNKLKGARV